MALRTAKKGKHAGDKFWGCSAFPDCLAILPYDPDAPAPKTSHPSSEARVSTDLPDPPDRSNPTN
jgi:ssDNA-binding Zn-finger/Zn-ribbon topoisomerase 1